MRFQKITLEGGRLTHFESQKMIYVFDSDPDFHGLSMILKLTDPRAKGELLDDWLENFNNIAIEA